MPHLLIVGGSDAGISAALRARELEPATEVTMLLADHFPNFSICGLPFYHSGEITDWRSLAHRTEADILREGIHLLQGYFAKAIDPRQKTVTVLTGDQHLETLPYDRLVICTGATPLIPRITGLDQPGVFFLRAMADSFALEDYLVSRAPQSAVIIGGGYIGLEMADALTLRGLSVTLVEHSPTVLKTVDADLGRIVGDTLQQHGVTVVTGVSVEDIAPQEKQLVVSGTPDLRVVADLVLVCVGVRPLVDLAQTAGIQTGVRGAIGVNRQMQTNLPDIYAAGDCVETWHRLLNRPVYLPLGTTAHKQGRIAGENAVGHPRAFAGTLGTQVLKVFELAIARTGLREDEALDAGFAPFTVNLETWDHKAYYPGAQRLQIRLTGDRATGQMLGAQMLGHYQSEVAKRIDIFATALYHHMTVEEVSDLDLSYTPPLSSPWDPVQMSAQTWSRAMSTAQVA